MWVIFRKGKDQRYPCIPRISQVWALKWAQVRSNTRQAEATRGPNRTQKKAQLEMCTDNSDGTNDRMIPQKKNEE